MLLLNAMQRIAMEEKPLLAVYAQASAPFLGELPIFHFKLPERYEYIWVKAYPDRLVLQWGFFRKRQKEILLSNIISFELAHLEESPYKMSLSEWKTKISFNEGDNAICLEMLPSKLSLLEFVELIKFLREKMPKKEKK